MFVSAVLLTDTAAVCVIHQQIPKGLRILNSSLFIRIVLFYQLAGHLLSVVTGTQARPSLNKLNYKYFLMSKAH